MISVIVPVLNEAKTLRNQIHHLAALDGDSEIIVIDGGSTDGTQEIVRAMANACLIEAQRGRGVQIQIGAEAARGDVLLVVHADSRLPADALLSVEQAIADGARWGWFDIRYDTEHAAMRLIPTYLNAHAWLLGEPTGENAMWSTREAWEEAGGCPRIPLMEDLELARRLRRVARGRRLPGPVVCSARRYRAWTAVGMSLRCATLWALFHLGASPETLERFYPEVR
ncbi:MAG: glycosyltransferase [Armatimonadia bacterium]|nr:glycosyltransferase [Armatimonadia bacterium]